MTQTKLKKKRLGYYAGEKLASLTENQIMNLINFYLTHFDKSSLNLTLFYTVKQ